MIVTHIDREFAGEMRRFDLIAPCVFAGAESDFARNCARKPGMLGVETPRPWEFGT